MAGIYYGPGENAGVKVDMDQPGALQAVDGSAASGASPDYLRDRALDTAARLYPGNPPDVVLAYARQFEAYLRGR